MAGLLRQNDFDGL